MRRERRVRFPRHRLVSDPGMHHGTCVTHVPWFMSGSLPRGGGENVPGIPGARTTRNFTYLVKGPLVHVVSSPAASGGIEHNFVVSNADIGHKYKFKMYI